MKNEKNLTVDSSLQFRSVLLIIILASLEVIVKIILKLLKTVHTNTNEKNQTNPNFCIFFSIGQEKSFISQELGFILISSY